MSIKLSIARKALFIGLLLASITACREPSQPLSHEEIIRADFAEILALENLECGKIVNHQLDDHLNYRINCETGDVYRIHVSKEGHVRVSSQEN